MKKLRILIFQDDMTHKSRLWHMDLGVLLTKLLTHCRQFSLAATRYRQTVSWPWWMRHFSVGVSAVVPAARPRSS